MYLCTFYHDPNSHPSFTFLYFQWYLWPWPSSNPWLLWCKPFSWFASLILGLNEGKSTSASLDVCLTRPRESGGKQEMRLMAWVWMRRRCKGMSWMEGWKRVSWMERNRFWMRKKMRKKRKKVQRKSSSKSEMPISSASGSTHSRALFCLFGWPMKWWIGSRHFGTFWDILGHFGTILEHKTVFLVNSDHFPIFGSFKKTHYG